MGVKKFKLIALVLSAAIFAGAMSVAASGNVRRQVPAGSPYQGQIDDINSRMQNLDQERKNLENSLASARDEKEREVLARNTIDDQIRITRSEISLLEERIGVLEQDIERQLAEIADKQAEIDANHALFLSRTRAMAMQDEASTLGLVLGADSFVSFLTRTDSMVRIADHDRKIGTALMEQRRELEVAKAALDARLSELEEDRRVTEERRQTLSNQLASANTRIHSIDQMEREFAADLERNRAESQRIQAELDEIFRRIEWSRNPFVGGPFAWPVPGFFRVTSEFGPRFGGSDFHTGIDIAGGGGSGSIHGAPVVAANTGTVRFVNWSHTPGRGYGIYLIIDHGGGISTLYAHLSNITVSLGDEVTVGQTIGNVGSTGWSTGPHLHFEVRENGRAVNPRPFIIG